MGSVSVIMQFNVSPLVTMYKGESSTRKIDPQYARMPQY